MSEEKTEAPCAAYEHVEEHPLLNVEQPKHWLLVLTILGLLLGLILWAFLGRIPTEESGKSVLMSSGGTFTVESPAEGELVKIYRVEGEQVEKGEALAEFSNPKLDSLLSSIESEKFKIQKLSSQARMLERAFQINTRLYEQGLIAKMVIDQSLATIMDKKIELSQAEANLTALFNELENNAFATSEEFLRIKAVLQKEGEPADRKQMVKRLSTLVAPSSGKILEVLQNPSDAIKLSEPIFWIENPEREGKPNVFYGTINAEVRGQLREGMKVLIEPATVNPKEYGAIRATVGKIYPYPVSEEEVLQTVGNKQIVRFLLEGKEVMLQVTLIPEKDPSTKSGYAWTSEKGPPYQVDTGTVAPFRIVVEEQPPISYLIPVWKVTPQ